MILVGMVMMTLVDILTQLPQLMMDMGPQLLYLPVILTLAMLLLKLIQASLLLMVMEPLLEQKGSTQHLELLEMTMGLLGNIRGTRMAFLSHLGKTDKVLDQLGLKRLGCALVDH